MKFIKESSLKDFKAWAGAVYTLQSLIDRNDTYQIEEFINCISEENGILTEIKINDILWFERDEIAQYMGYEDWEDYLKNKKPIYFK